MAREDYSPQQRAAWRDARLAGERARGQGQHAAGVNQLPRYNKATMDPFGSHGKLADAIAKPVAATLKTKSNELDRIIASKVKKGQTLEADIDSECLSALSWRDGVAYYSFWRGGSIDYSTPMSKSDWLEWVEYDFPGAGVFGNAEVFD
jgi:hypothetical protein